MPSGDHTHGQARERATGACKGHHGANQQACGEENSTIVISDLTAGPQRLTLAPGSCGQRLRAWLLSPTKKNTAMKHSLFLTMLAAALMGGQVFADPVVYSVDKDWSDGQNAAAFDTEATILVDAQKTLGGLDARSDFLTLDYQGEFVLTASGTIDTPDVGVLNITSTVDAVKTKWEDTFSVEGGGSITLCHAGSIDDWYDTVQFFGTDANNTVKLGNTEVKFMGVVKALPALDMNQVVVVWGEQDMLLVGKLEKSVPEPTTGTLSLLALAGLCARRRRK